MTKTKLVFLAMGNAIICAQAFLMIGMAMADSGIVLQPGFGALVAALVLFVTSGVNMTAIYELQRRAARRRAAAARKDGRDWAAETIVRQPLDVDADILEAYSRELSDNDTVLRTARLFRERMTNSPGFKKPAGMEGIERVEAPSVQASAAQTQSVQASAAQTQSVEAPATPHPKRRRRVRGAPRTTQERVTG